MLLPPIVSLTLPHTHTCLGPHSQVVIGSHGKLKTWAAKRVLSLDTITILVRRIARGSVVISQPQGDWAGSSNRGDK